MNSLKKDKKSRDPSSFRRSAPQDYEITKEETFKIDTCPDCGSLLIKGYFIIRYIEDILLPYLDEKQNKIISPSKTVIKQMIEKGWCPKCRCWHTAKLPAHSPPVKNNEVLLGKNVKEYISYKTYMGNGTYQKIKDELFDLYNISLSDGEITQILDQTALKLAPEKERIKREIQEEKVKHIDETSGQRGGDKNYTWAMASAKTEKVVFEVGKNRGKGNAEELLGDNDDAVRVTDFYVSYKNIKGHQQPCWIHFIRKPKELAENANLSKNKRKFAAGIYNDLLPFYNRIRAITQTEFVLEHRMKLLPKLKKKLNKIISRIERKKNNPKKMDDFAKLAREYYDQLFTCIIYPDVPPDNNKAERKIRPLVIKRKLSFGTKSEKGDNTFSANATVLFSLWWQDRANFWPKFRELIA